MMSTRYEGGMAASAHVVLIVDDVPENLAVLSDALDEAGHTVLVATDGASALERLLLVMPDLILLDAVMPGIDGFETCRRMKLMDSARDVPVVFMTGLTETEHVVRGFEVGGIDYVTKPIRPAEVLARISTHVRNARMLSEARHTRDTALPVASADLSHYQLTPRELDVLAWIARGKTNRDIAEILGMSPRTVNKHLEHIFVKLGVETRAAAAALVASLR
ncbi:response regulator [Noviherbaspirillum suwonense]|uniref:Two component transcriptional regulator, LuxR family n=1 Tax=Noviherbaspirillum suwonense TaxID=1224511 RepID=A0ABY1QA37_9BURK|nr:response regulator [Noviherbaspirillum suwonense]SMP64517.1 two component transcriptional regulator, LuxR family [Noviherbaspirillum suwonense]